MHEAGKLAGNKAGIDADMHVMAGDVVDEGMNQVSQQMGKSSACGFGKDEGLEVFRDCSELSEHFAFEVMEEKIGDEDATGRWRIGGKEIALVPADVGRQVRRRRGEIVGVDGGGGEFFRETAREVAIAGTDFGNALGNRSGEPGDGAEDPAFVSHEGIDHAEIPAAADGARVIRREMIEDFG